MNFSYDSRVGSPSRHIGAIVELTLGLSVALTLCFPSSAHAYIGAALSAGGAVMAGLLILSLLLAVYVLVWFPIRRRLRERAQGASEESSAGGATRESETSAQADSSDDVG